MIGRVKGAERGGGVVPTRREPPKSPEIDWKSCCYLDSDSDVPCPAILQRADLTKVVELVLDDDAVQEFDALVAKLSLDAQT